MLDGYGQYAIAGLTDSCRPTLRWRWVPQAASASAVLVGGVVLVGWWLDVVTLKSLTPVFPTMKANTALAFVLAGLSLWCSRDESANGWRQGLALGVAASGYVMSIVYLYGEQALLDFAPLASVAPHAAWLFTALSIGILFARPDCGFMEVITGGHCGGFMARRLMGVVIVIPLIGWVRLLGERTGRLNFRRSTQTLPRRPRQSCPTIGSASWYRRKRSDQAVS